VGVSISSSKRERDRDDVLSSARVNPNLNKKGAFREKNLSIPAAAGSSPSMPLLVFWPLLAPRHRHCFSALRSAVVV